MWKRSKKWNGDGAAPVGTMALHASQATKGCQAYKKCACSQCKSLLFQGIQSFLTFRSHSIIHLPSLVSAKLSIQYNSQLLVLSNNPLLPSLLLPNTYSIHLIGTLFFSLYKLQKII